MDNPATMIRLAIDEAQVAACHPVMAELREGIEREAFVRRVRRQQQTGYRLAYGAAAGAPVVVAGFRIGENLAWGRYLYVEDLVVSAASRSQGWGARMYAWLRGYALEAGCGQLHLDSGLAREGAHRFYLRQGMAKAGFHFVDKVAPS